MKTSNTKILFKDESYRVIGACMEVHRKLGQGFLESVYSEALELEFEKEGVPYEKEKKLPVYYDEQPLKKFFKADFVCFNSIILELKSEKFLSVADRKQAVNYLKATKFNLAILVNFNTPSLIYKRIVSSL
jgi:GxxExxY protein